jgi:hypothetical protein
MTTTSLFFNDSEDIIFPQDEMVLAVEFDLSTGVLAGSA